MANINLSPNPNGSSITLSGSGTGDVSSGSSIYIKSWRENWHYVLDPLVGWTWKIYYGGGNDPSDYRIEGTVNTGYKKVAGFIGQTQPIDAGDNTANSVSISIHALKDDDTVEVNAGIYICSNISWEKASTNSEGETTHTSGTSQYFGLNTNNPGWAPALPRVYGDIETNIPIFETAAQADDFLLTGEGSPINEPKPVELNDYNYYIYNMISSSPGSGAEYEYYYRYSTTTNGRLAFYKNHIIGQPMYDRTLIGVENINQIYKGSSPQEDPMPMASSTVLNFLGNAVKYDNGDAWYPIMYQTNIPTFDTKEHAETYILNGDETGIIDKWREDGIIDPEIGEPTDQTEQGENGAVYTYGNRMYRMSNTQMATFFSDVFDPDPSITQALLDGLQLFGSNQINAIHDIMYLPLSVNDIATLSATTNITIGTYTMPHAEGDPIQKNDKMINMGSHFFAAPYGAGDYRNYSPYCRAYVMLPYAGTHELQIDKYINKYVTIKLAVDVTTGAGTYYIYGGQTIFDTFDCIIGAHRPITAVDHASHVAATTNAILQTLPSVGQAVVSVGNPTAGGVASAAANSAGAILKGYEAMNTAVNAPMTERGSFHGFVSMFDVTSPYFIFAQMQTKAPQNLLMLKGKPSSAGGKLSSFWGHFEAAEVDLPSFSGTQAEAEELISILKGGIYID